jgi:hypothetical protein
MKNIRESLKRTIKEMEENNAREIVIYKMLKKYVDDFGIERSELLVKAIMKQLSDSFSPSRVSDFSISDNPIMENMMGPDDTIEDLGDSLMSSSKLDDILTNTYASDFNDEFEYAENIISFLISEFEGQSFYDELFNYIKDIYGERFIDLYQSGEDDYFDGDNDEEFFN